MASLHICL